MKILLVHNFHRYGAPSGDDKVFENEANLLKNKGHSVIIYKRRNDELFNATLLKRFPMWMQSVWSLKSYRDIKKIIHKDNPDIAHFHNIFPLISPSAYYACNEMGVPIVQTLHDFRFLCPIAFFFRDGHICEECAKEGLWKSIKYGCFRDSHAQSAIVSFMLWFYKSMDTLRKKVNMFICLTESERRKFVEFGFTKERIAIKPNFFSPIPENRPERGGYAIFMGRLSHEKGVHILLEAWRGLKKIPLKILGDGPQRDELEGLAKREGLKDVEFLGFKPHSEAIKLLQGARFAIMPSICYETFGLTIIEAFACSKPVIASDLGAMSDLIRDGENGLLFEPGSSSDLAQKAGSLWEDPDRCIQMGTNAREEYEAKYTPEKNYEMLMGIYNKVIEIKRSGFN